VALARLSNLRPLIRLGVWLVIFAVVVNLALRGLAATPVLGWLPDRQTGTGFDTDNRERITGAEAEYRNGLARPDRRLGAIVGISNIREAVDLDMMNRQLGRGWRFIGLAGAGAGAASIVDNARLLEQSQLKPDLVIVGTAPLQLLDGLLPGAYTPPAPSRADRAKKAAKDLLWMKARRRDVSVSTERALLDLRARLFRAFDVRLPTQDTQTPWRSMLRVMGTERSPDEVFTNGVTWAASFGAFDQAAYERSVRAPAMLASTLKQLAARGARPVVVLTPEHSLLRSREPAQIAKYIKQRLRRDTGMADLLVLDYRSAVPDDGFVDLVHLNSKGSKQFTPLLLRDVQRLRWRGLPLATPTVQPANTET
jgi:hypothetical protein